MACVLRICMPQVSAQTAPLADAPAADRGRLSGHAIFCDNNFPIWYVSITNVEACTGIGLYRYTYANLAADLDI